MTKDCLFQTLRTNGNIYQGKLRQALSLQVLHLGQLSLSQSCWCPMQSTRNNSTSQFYLMHGDALNAFPWAHFCHTCSSSSSTFFLHLFLLGAWRDNKFEPILESVLPRFDCHGFLQGLLQRKRLFIPEHGDLVPGASQAFGPCGSWRKRTKNIKADDTNCGSAKGA